MVWLTLFTGLTLFGIGIGCRYLVPLTQWQALLPVVFGLFYLTMAEGLRSKPALRRMFHFVALLWSMVVVVVSLPLAREFFHAWNHGAVVHDGVPVRPELIFEHAAVLLVSLLYFAVAAVQFWRLPPK